MERSHGQHRRDHPGSVRLRVRVDTVRRTAQLNDGHAFDVDRLLALISEGTAGWSDTVAEWADGGPADRSRAVVAIAHAWRSPAWAPSRVRAPTQRDPRSQDRQAFVDGIQLYDAGPRHSRPRRGPARRARPCWTDQSRPITRSSDAFTPTLSRRRCPRAGRPVDLYASAPPVALAATAPDRRQTEGGHPPKRP